MFALSIHMLSRTPEGECQGQVLKYNPESRELTVNDALSRVPIKLRVPAGTAFVRAAQAASSSGEVGPSNLVKGTLISVRYESDNQGRGIASQIAILATPDQHLCSVGMSHSSTCPPGNWYCSTRMTEKIIRFL